MAYKKFQLLMFFFIQFWFISQLFQPFMVYKYRISNHDQVPLFMDILNFFTSSSFTKNYLAVDGTPSQILTLSKKLNDI